MLAPVPTHLDHHAVIPSPPLHWNVCGQLVRHQPQQNPNVWNHLAPCRHLEQNAPLLLPLACGGFICSWPRLAAVALLISLVVTFLGHLFSKYSDTPPPRAIPDTL